MSTIQAGSAGFDGLVTQTLDIKTSGSPASVKVFKEASSNDVLHEASTFTEPPTLTLGTRTSGQFADRW